MNFFKTSFLRRIDFCFRWPSIYAYQFDASFLFCFHSWILSPNSIYIRVITVNNSANANMNLFCILFAYLSGTQHLIFSGCSICYELVSVGFFQGFRIFMIISLSLSLTLILTAKDRKTLNY